MTTPATDHRRATAERNAAAIVDAAERLLAGHTPLSMAAIAAEAGVSRVTLYAHFKRLEDVLEAVGERAIAGSLAAIEGARLDEGPAVEALRRMLRASWGELARHDALARAAAEHLPSGHVHRTHAPLMKRLLALTERGQREGDFRTDMPADWLVSMFYALIHGAGDHARARRLKRATALDLLETSVLDLFTARER